MFQFVAVITYDTSFRYHSDEHNLAFEDYRIPPQATSIEFG